ALADGMRFLRTHPIILAVLSLDFFATFFGSPRALLPIYASNILRVGPEGLGILLAATSIGAIALTPITGRIGRIPQQGVWVVRAILGWGVCIVLFGLLPGPFWLSALLLAGAGGGGVVRMVVRGVIVRRRAPRQLRGRMSAGRTMLGIGG